MRGAVLGISSLLAYLMLLVSKAELFLGHAQFVHFRLFAYSLPPLPWLCCHEKLGMQKPRSFSYCVYCSTFYFLVDYYFYYVHNVERRSRVFDARLIRDQKFGWTFFPPFCSPIFQKQSKLFTFHLFFSYSLYLEEYIFLLSHFSTPQKNFWQPRFERLPMTECFIERSQWGYQMKNAA